MDIKWMVRHTTIDDVNGMTTVYYGPYDREQDAADLVELIVLSNLSNFNDNAYLEELFSPIYVNA